MSRYKNTLSTLQARTILSAVSDFTGTLATKKEIEKAALSIIENLENLFPSFYPVSDEENMKNPDNMDLHKGYIAWTLSACAREGIKRGELLVLDYIAMLANVKEENEKTLSDYGAFGDLFEILVRCALLKKITLVNWSALTVKDVKTTDIISKKYGKIEVGHNGKSLTFGTLFDYMAGDYDSVIYGVFSDEDKKIVYALCKEKQYTKVIDYITSYSAYFSDKYDFQNTMDNLTRGKGITAKGSDVQVVFNPGKYNAFMLALDNGEIKSLKETLSE